MCAVDGEDLKLLRRNTPYPARYFGCFAIAKARDWACEVDEPRLTDGKIVDRAKRNPATGAGGFLHRGTEQIAGERHRQHGAHRGIQQHGHLKEKAPPGVGSRLFLGRRSVVA